MLPLDICNLFFRAMSQSEIISKVQRVMEEWNKSHEVEERLMLLSIQQGFEGNDYLNAFFDQLKEHGIPYELKRTKENDTAHFLKM